jgi:hypothetical protein
MKNLIGKYVIVRDDKAGVFFGILSKKENTELTLTKARKLYYWSGANTVEQLAVEGVQNPDSCKFTQIVDIIVLSNYNQILPCTDNAIYNLNSIRTWKFQKS